VSSTSTQANTQKTTDSRGGRILVAGVSSGALFTAGYLLSGYIPGGGQTDPTAVTDFYNRTSTGTAYLLFLGLLAAAVCLIWYFTLLSSRLGESNQTCIDVADRYGWPGPRRADPRAGPTGSSGTTLRAVAEAVEVVSEADGEARM